MRKRLLTTLSVLVAVVGVTACQPAASGSSSSGSAVATVAAAEPESEPTPAVLSIEPATGSKNVRPDSPVTVSVVGGELDAVTVTTADGTKLDGEADGAGTWHLTDPLASAGTYTVTAAATGMDGVSVSERSSFTTARASSLVSTTLIPGDDWVVGVGMPIVVVFSKPVKNKSAAETGLSVTSTPAVEGAWRWFSSTEVHWRPKKYWPSGTTVHVSAAMSDVELAKGVWGKRTTTSDFTIGRSQILTVNTATHKLTVERDGAVVKTIPVTTGKAGYRTRNGIKVIMSRESKVRMDASTVGTDTDSPDYYNLLVNWALRLTWSGEYLHAAPWSVGSQGRANVSHGCTGMSTTNARWLFDNSKVGDVVVFTGSKRALEWGNGYTDWNKTFDTYAAGA